MDEETKIKTVLLVLIVDHMQRNIYEKNIASKVRKEAWISGQKFIAFQTR